MNSLPTTGINRAAPTTSATAKTITSHFSFKTNRRNPAYRGNFTERIAFPPSAELLRNRELSMGMTRIATQREENSENATVQAWSLNSSPEEPCRYTIGRKTTIVVMVEAVIAPLTWLVPVTVASFTPMPDSRLRKMFSITTIALSTSIPAPNAKPPSVMILIVNPLKYIRLNVATIEIGIAKLIIAVTPRRRKNTNSTRTARKMPRSAVCFTSSMALPINSPLFCMTVNSYPGRAFRIVSRVSVSSSTAFTVL